MATKVKADVMVRFVQGSDGVMRHVGYVADVQVWEVSQSPQWLIGRFTVSAEKDGDLVQVVLERVQEVRESYDRLEAKKQHVRHVLQQALEEEYAEAKVDAYLCRADGDGC